MSKIVREDNARNEAWLAEQKRFAPWPCATTPYDSCPGLGQPTAHGGDGGHCTACHRLYTGYVLLCPVHENATGLLAALKGLLRAIDGPCGDALSDAGKLDAARASVAKAEGKCRRLCDRPDGHIEDFDCNDWPEGGA